MFGAVLIMVLGCLILPRLLPLVMWSISTLTEAIVEWKMATQLYLLQGHHRVNPISEDERDDAFWQIKCQSIKGGNVGASLALFLGLLCLVFTLVSPLWVYKQLSASSAVFPVTVTTFCRGLGDKLCKYLIQLLTQIRARSFEKLSPLGLLA
jgi:hypothetical protein